MAKVLAGVAALAVVCGAAHFAFLPPPPRTLFYRKKHALHGGLVPSDVLAHLCDLHDILHNESHSRRCKEAFDDLLGSIRAFYMALAKNEKHAVVKTMGKEAREKLAIFEAHAARSFFVHDIMRSLAFIGDEIMNTMLRPQGRRGTAGR